MAASMSASFGLGLLANSALADMIWPDWQYPHCGTSRASHAAWIRLPAGVAPFSPIVVIFLPATADTGAIHDRVGAPSIWTVHAPHSPSPQPNLLPVRLSTSRSVHNKGISLGTSRLWSFPFTFSAINDIPPL